MSAQADTNCHDIFNVVSATRTHLAKIGATYYVVPTCHGMSATFPPKVCILYLELCSCWSTSWHSQQQWWWAQQECVWGHLMELFPPFPWPQEEQRPILYCVVQMITLWHFHLVTRVALDRIVLGISGTVGGNVLFGWDKSQHLLHQKIEKYSA